MPRTSCSLNHTSCNSKIHRIFQHEECWKWGNIQTVMTTVFFSQHAAIDIQCYRLWGAWEPGMCIPHCHYLHLTRKHFLVYLFKHHGQSLNKLIFPFPSAWSIFHVCKFLLCFGLGWVFYPFCKSQVSFGLSFGLTNSQEPYLLWRASPCSCTLTTSAFIPHGHVPSQLICLLPAFLLFFPLGAVVLWNNKIAAYFFRMFSLILGYPLEKISICAFHKGHESRVPTKFCRVSNSTRMRVSCLSFFSCFAHLLPETQVFLLSDLERRSHQKIRMASFVILSYKEFYLKTASVSCCSSWSKDLLAQTNAVWK